MWAKGLLYNNQESMKNTTGSWVFILATGKYKLDYTWEISDLFDLNQPLWD